MEEQSKSYKHVIYRSILVITTKGIIVRIYCPFPVKNKESVILTVDAVAIGNDNSIHYRIEGILYKYSLFSILCR